MKPLLTLAALLLLPSLALAGVADGNAFTCTGDGPETQVVLTGPDSATVQVDGADSSFTVSVRADGGKKVLQIAKATSLSINPEDGKGVLSSTNGKGRDHAYACRNM